MTCLVAYVEHYYITAVLRSRTYCVLIACILAYIVDMIYIAHLISECLLHRRCHCLLVSFITRKGKRALTQPASHGGKDRATIRRRILFSSCTSCGACCSFFLPCPMTRNPHDVQEVPHLLSAASSFEVAADPFLIKIYI